ncbi:MAG: CopD family protein [Anaerolineae bacterium]|nr:CopD family protein [Anaerolineae bacterium]
MSQSILAVSLFFHLIATVVWIGGLVILTVLVWPETRRILAENPGVYSLLTRLRRRFLPLTNLSLAVLIVTGLFQMTADPNYEGVLQFGNDWSRAILLKHLAVGGMVICGVALQFWVAPALERASLLVERQKGDPDEWARLHRLEVRLTWINVALGVLVLGFTAWATAL